MKRSYPTHLHLLYPHLSILISPYPSSLTSSHFLPFSSPSPGIWQGSMSWKTPSLMRLIERVFLSMIFIQPVTEQGFIAFRLLRASTLYSNSFIRLSELSCWYNLIRPLTLHGRLLSPTVNICWENSSTTYASIAFIPSTAILSMLSPSPLHFYLIDLEKWLRSR